MTSTEVILQALPIQNPTAILAALLALPSGQRDVLAATIADIPVGAIEFFHEATSEAASLRDPELAPDPLTAEQEALVREWTDGQRRPRRLRTNRPLSEGKTLTVIVQLLATLDATRAELEIQWQANHMEHCGQLFVDHRAGTKICTWPRPATLPPGFPDVWPG